MFEGHASRRAPPCRRQRNRFRGLPVRIILPALPQNPAKRMTTHAKRHLPHHRHHRPRHPRPRRYRCPRRTSIGLGPSSNWPTTERWPGCEKRSCSTGLSREWPVWAGAAWGRARRLCRYQDNLLKSSSTQRRSRRRCRPSRHRPNISARRPARPPI